MSWTALTAFPAAALVIWTLLRSAPARRVVAAPRGDRWHQQATPSFGGVGIFAGLLAGVGASLAAGAVEPSWELFGILGGCTVLFAAGLADDLYSLGPMAKIGAQLAAAGIVLASGLSAQLVTNDILAGAIAVVWLVGMTNAFNLLDNMDGLAATLAAIACAFFAIDEVTVHPSGTVLALSLSLGLACAGFLPFNLRPGRPAAVFMGDSGSQVLGFALASLGLAASWKLAGTTVATFLLPILILAVPILDTTLVTVIRLLEGRPIHHGGRDHTSHRLVYRGLSEQRAVVLLALIATGLGATSLAYNIFDNPRVTLVGVLVTFALLVQFASFLSDIAQDPDAVREGGPLLVRTFLRHRRRFVEMVVDLALFGASFLAAYLLRLEGSGDNYQRYIFYVSFPVIVACRYAAFIPFGLYRSVWRYAGARDAAAVVGAVMTSELAAFGILSATRDFGNFPRTIFVIDALLCTVLVGLSRFGERALFRALSLLKRREEQSRTLIVGAGRGGRSLVRELREAPGERIVGFVDDDPQLRRRRLHGVSVLGSADEIERILARARPDVVLVTIPDAPRARLDVVVDACARTGIPCRFVRRETDLDPRVVLSAAAE